MEGLSQHRLAGRRAGFQTAYGRFREDAQAYLITRPDTPRPWVNVICNGDYGMIETQTGSGFSWRGNSNLSRITRWDQDLIRDSWGKYLYIKDRESGDFWSATWKPCAYSSMRIRSSLKIPRSS